MSDALLSSLHFAQVPPHAHFRWTTRPELGGGKRAGLDLNCNCGLALLFFTATARPPYRLPTFGLRHVPPQAHLRWRTPVRASVKDEGGAALA
jgi:hypothetical protein